MVLASGVAALRWASTVQQEALTNLAAIVVDRMEARRFRQIGRIAEKVVDVTSDAILCADVSGRITFWNAAAERMFGQGFVAR